MASTLRMQVRRVEVYLLLASFPTASSVLLFLRQWRESLHGASGERMNFQIEHKNNTEKRRIQQIESDADKFCCVSA